MRGIRFLAALAVVMAAAVPAQAVQVIYGDFHAGIFLTIDVPDEYSAEVPFTVDGYLLASVGLVVEEAAVGIPDEEIDILVNGVVTKTVTSDDAGHYETTLSFDGAPPTTRTIQAFAFRGELYETKSRSVPTHLDRLWTELSIVPSSVTVAEGGSVQLRAWGVDEDGREADLTDRVTWTSANTATATVSNDAPTKGVVDGITVGSTEVQAKLYHLTASAGVTVSG